MKFKKLGALILGALLSIGVAAGVGATVEKDVAYAAGETTYSYTFSAKQYAANGTKTLKNVNWTLSGNGDYWGYDGTKGQQFGSGSKPYKSLTFKSASFTNVSEIKISTSGASSINGSFITKIGDTQVGSSTNLTTSNTEYTFRPTSPITGQVSFNYTQTSSKAIYIKSISVTYNANAEPVSKEQTINADAESVEVNSSITLETTAESATWSLSNENATLSSKTGKTVTLTGVTEGTVDVTATANGYKDATITITITAKQSGGDEPSVPSTTVTDNLTRATTGVTNTSYNTWSGKTLESTAVYAGNSAGSYSSIQLKSKDNNSGIITTASGGNVKKVVVEWNSNTSNGRTLNIYGKNSAYSSVADLYDNSKLGTSLGTIVCGTSTELEITSEYKYIGLKSSDGAMYLTSISITWEPQQEVVTPPTSLTLDKTNASVARGLNLTLIPTFDANVSDSQRTITWSADPSNKGVSVDKNGVVSVANDAKIGAVVTIKAQSVVETVFATCTITVAKEELVSLDRNGFNYFYEGQIISESKGELKAKYSNGSETLINIATDENLTIKLGDVDIASSYALKLEDSGKKLIFTYKDGEKTATKDIENINVTKYFAISNLSTSFASGKEYIDSSITGENKINFSYSCWADTTNLSMEVTVNGSPVLEPIGKEDKVINKNTNNTSNGYVSLTPKTDANGQVEITITLSVIGQDPVSSSITILVRNDEPTYSGGSSWNKLTDVNQVTDGTYVIAAEYSGKYYAMSNAFASKNDAFEIPVENNKISSNDLTNYQVEIKRTDDTITIKNSSTYLAYKSSSDFKVDTNSYNWNLNQGKIGTFRLIASTSATRAIAYQKGGERFGPYATSNLTTNGEYSDIELFKLTQTDGGWDDTTVVQNFVKDYMHHDEFASFNEGNGGCLGNEGYYAKALAQITDDKMTTAQLLILRNTFKLSYERLQAWAIANGGTFKINDAGEIVTTSAGLNGVLINNDQYTIIITLLAIVTLSGFAFFYVTKRKNKELEF